MARQPRKVSATGYYHVMVRGISKEHVFNTDQDKYVFLNYIDEELTESNIAITAWCIMSNHTHFVVKADLNDISKFIKIILIRFAAYYNNQYQRVGPVFGDRYRSEVIEDDSSLKQVVRYVHQNPIKADLVSNIEEYKFSSYLEYLGKERIIEGNQIKFIKAYFNNNLKRFINFHKEEVINLQFIEIKEDRQMLLDKACDRIIADFCSEHEVECKQHLMGEIDLFNELIAKLVNAGLSYRKIANILGASFNHVYYVANRSKSRKNSTKRTVPND